MLLEALSGKSERICMSFISVILDDKSSKSNQRWKCGILPGIDARLAAVDAVGEDATSAWFGGRWLNG